MPERGEAPDVVRIVEGLSGRVEMRSELRLRFGYGDVVPWVRHLDGMLAGVAGPDAVWLASDVPHHGRDFASYADFLVEPGDTVNFVLDLAPVQPAPTVFGRPAGRTRGDRDASGRTGHGAAPMTVPTATPSCVRSSP